MTVDRPHIIDIGPLVPDRYADYRSAIATCFGEFVLRSGLARSADTATSDPSAAGALLRVMPIVRQSPTLHKLGQVLARHKALDADLRAQLQTLESLAPATPMPPILACIHEELRRTDAPPVRVQRRALAEGSVAVVVPFTWHDGDATVEGVFKVLRPGIVERLDAELSAWAAVGAHLDETCDENNLPPIPYRETFEQVRELLLNEVRLDLEQAHLAEAAACYAGDDDVRVPRVLPFGTARMTAMEHVDGRLIADVNEPAMRRRAAETIVRAMIAGPLLSDADAALFHADPHAGNLMIDADGRLVPLDWSLAGRLSRDARTAAVQLLLGAMQRDAGVATRATEALADRVVDAHTLRDRVGSAVQSLPPFAPPGVHWLTALLDGLVVSNAARFAGDLMLFRKSLLTLEGVVADVCDAVDVDAVLMQAVMRQLADEWPRRMLSFPMSRSFGTHLSNADLWSAAWSVPAAATRHWLAAWQRSMTGVFRPFDVGNGDETAP